MYTNECQTKPTRCSALVKSAGDLLIALVTNDEKEILSFSSLIILFIEKEEKVSHKNHRQEKGRRETDRLFVGTNIINNR